MKRCGRAAVDANLQIVRHMPLRSYSDEIEDTKPSRCSRVVVQSRQIW